MGLSGNNPAKRLAIGTVQFGQSYGIANIRGRVSEGDVRDILAYARDAGIDMLDTAIAYGDAEQSLGRVGVSDFHIISKIPAIPRAGASVDQWLLGQIEQSLKKLDVECLYGVLLHHPDDLLGPFASEICTALLEAKSRGWVGRIGVSVYEPNQLEAVIGRIPMELVQIPINVFDRRFEVSGWLNRLSAQGIEVHGRSAFLQGLLLMPPDAIPMKFTRFSSLFLRWHTWLASKRISALQACLAHVASYPELARYVVGCDSLGHCREIVAAIKESASRAPAELASSDSILLNPSLWERL